VSHLSSKKILVDDSGQPRALFGDVFDLVVDAAIVEPVDLGKVRPINFVDVVPRSPAADQFGLVETAEALGGGSDTRSATTIKRVHCAGFGETFGVADRQVLHCGNACVGQDQIGMHVFAAYGVIFNALAVRSFRWE